MTIHIDSWQSAMVFVLTVGAILTAAGSLHWKIFAGPRLKNILAPYGERLDVVTRVVREKYPQEYGQAERDMAADRRLRGAI